MSGQHLLVLLRAGQLYAHHAHNNCGGPTFHQDHEYFGEVYPAFEAAFDSVAERMISEVRYMDTLEITVQAAKHAATLERKPGDGNSAFYRGLLTLEMKLCDCVEACLKESLPEGTRQLFGDIANESMIRQYKICQRLR